MRILAHLRELDEYQKDWERYQTISLEDLRDREKGIWFFMPCWSAFRQP
ncbi:hypothetical protein [Methanosarcina acetivorans]|nr:hypothetical protein [Methanosarcina acetivorans]